MDNSTPDISEKLVLYIDGALADSDKKAVEGLIASDTAVQAGYESLLAARAAVMHYGLRQKVASIHKKMMEETGAPVRSISPARKIFRYSMAAAAGLLLLIGAYTVYNFISLSPGKVFSANYRGYELSNTRDVNGPESTAAEKAFAAKNYKEIIRIHDAGEDHSPKGEFLCGVSALELKDDAKAIKCFNEVLEANKKSGQNILNDESEYYLSLGYIRNKDYDFALVLLKKIKNDPEHKYHRDISAGLIRKVKMLKWR